MKKLVLIFVTIVLLCSIPCMAEEQESEPDPFIEIEVPLREIRINPADADVYSTLGHDYYIKGKYKEAIDAFKVIMKISPDDTYVHSNIGHSYYILGMYKEAIDAFKQVVRINPDDAVAHNNLGAAFGKAGMLKETIDAHRQAIRINPGYAESHFNLGLAYTLSALEQYKILKPLDSELANKLSDLISK